MNCPICGGRAGVTCTLTKDDAVYRYRKCTGCKYIFKTVELDTDLLEKLPKKETAKHE